MDEDLKQSEVLTREKIQAEIAKVFAEIETMRAETTKLQGESRWYPFVVCSGLILAAMGLLKLIP